VRIWLAVRRALYVIAVLATSALAAPPAKGRDSVTPAKLEDTCLDRSACKQHALDAFRTALAAQRNHKAEHPLRVSYFGDSLTADDHITDSLRGKLQALVGDGGAGFVFAAPPHPYCQHRAVARVVSDGWDVRGISTIGTADHLLGLGGSAESSGGATIKLVPKGKLASVELHYLAQPNGGTLDVACDGKVVSSIATAAERKRAAFSSLVIPDGTKRIELRTRGRVRVFGAALEAKAGAVVDNLGVVNATAKGMHKHNLAEHWRNQLAHRAADLVVVMYGANEAEWLQPKGKGIAEHERLFGELLATVRAANPQASCLVVSPLDQLDWRGEKLAPRESIPAMVEAQRKAAVAQGCAFWDAYTWMGGSGSSREWFKRGWIVKDYQHPTSEGAGRIAEALYQALVN
jgi:lysophospholipase L1-like esterase